MMISSEKPVSKMFEITVCVRNSKGEDTGKKRTFASDSAYKISEFWHKYVGNIPTKKKANTIPTAKEAETILANMYANTPE